MPVSKLAFQVHNLQRYSSGAFTTVMNRRHNFLDRNAILIRACAEPVTTVGALHVGIKLTHNPSPVAFQTHNL
jgi:hypothetical protein